MAWRFWTVSWFAVAFSTSAVFSAAPDGLSGACETNRQVTNRHSFYAVLKALFRLIEHAPAGF
jgi:hypothetical protein